MKLTEQTMKEMLQVAMGNQVRNRIDDQHGGVRTTARGCVGTNAFYATWSPEENNGNVIIDIIDNDNRDYETDRLTVRRISRRRYGLFLGSSESQYGSVSECCMIAAMSNKGRFTALGDFPEFEFWVA